MPLWTEIADRVYLRRYEPLDISVTLVRGSDGVLLIDTRCNPREAAEIRADVTTLGFGDVTRVVNTHAHYDHTFGNSEFATTATLYGHHLLPAHFAAFEAPRLSDWQAAPDAQPQYDWRGVILTPPTVLVDEDTELDIGGRIVHLLPLEPGHTDTDLAVFVPDAEVWMVGDVVEQSGPPMYGSGSFPFSWPDQVDALVARISETAVVVPGHGAQGVTAVDGGLHDGEWQVRSPREPIELVADRIAGRTNLPLAIVEAAVYRGYTLRAAEDSSL
jgi:glyoxylase-like metal-dependent hydrolase (beta-lactamase superfamily II)